MPKIVVTARAASITLIVSCLVPSLPVRGAVPEMRSEDGDVGRGWGSVQSTTRASDAPRASCPLRWPYIVLTCTA
ncbi:hypothetical protein ASF53_19225 [Methylobacterium sp. Leaf123]|uniref:hypothetical protein n=1 Tax=Methylobacterium sp. Leaf123 TaxID=1736264 RepID=UPI0006FD7F73|nr:hypothetical protein [Methylobacterium sp. Leaf123]KQQ29369.1 hypothetical protein ASF53_19225 [Methylobacterium sp. Leaf123]